MNKKVLLVEPTYLDLYGKSKIATKPYFPLGLGYIAAALKKNNYDCRILISSDGDDFLNKVMVSVREFDPLFIGFTSMTTNYPNAVELAKEIKKVFSLPIVIGGIHVSAFREEILKQTDVFDYVVYGEGEDTIVELACNLNDPMANFGEINGLIWKSSSGQIVVNPPRRLENDLDKIPFPARELVDLDKFSTHSHIAGGRSATIMTSRGCPYQCVFCSAHNVHGHKYREHSVDYVISEIEELVNKYNVTYVFIEDDTFTVNKKRVERICKRLSDKKLNLKFGCFSRVDIMDLSMARLLKKAGCINVIFGIESGDEEVLKKMKKHISLVQAKEAIQVCEKIGIKTFASFVIGFPFDTKETIKKTIDFALELNSTLVAFNPLVPFPGSEIFNDAKHLPKHIEDWKSYITVNVPPYSFVDGLTPRDIYKLAQKGNRRFYLRPGQLWRIIKTIQSFSDLKEYFKAAIAVFGR
ncbi:MAG: radical SAM protein [Candidatus Omnitrophota bacterium]